MVTGTASALVVEKHLGVTGGIFASVGALFFTVGAIVGFATCMWKQYDQLFAGHSDAKGKGDRKGRIEERPAITTVSGKDSPSISTPKQAIKIARPSRSTSTIEVSGRVIAKNTLMKPVITKDVSSDPTTICLRRRLEWPVVDDRCFQDLDNGAAQEATPDAKVLADSLIDSELVKCGGLDDSLHEDRSITNELASCQVMKRPRKQLALLHALYWRARQQSAVWKLSTYLVALGLLDPKALEAPVELHGLTDAVRNVWQQLCCFQLPLNEDNLDWEDYPYELWGSYQFSAIRWLAIMITRGCIGDMAEIMEVIAGSRCLGSLNMEAYDNFLARLACDKSLCFTFNLDESKPLGEDMVIPPFGFWLPNNIPAQIWTKEAMKHVCYETESKFNNIERAYKNYFNFPDNVLPLHKEQEQ
ncbi:MAG: hypothetical protein Q9192_005523 [Flavoplaca navasiana]